MGRPVPGVEVEMRDETAPIVAGGHGGAHLGRAGPSVMAGYFGAAPRPPRAALVDGWLDTGDLGFVADGELFVCGRAKDVVILRGANHVAAGVRGVPRRARGRARRAARWRSAPRAAGADGEELVLLVETRGRIDAWTWRTAFAPASSSAPASARTGRLLAPGTLPRTSSGKLRRREALRRWHTGELSRRGRSRWFGLAGAMLRRALAFARVDQGA